MFQYDEFLSLLKVIVVYQCISNQRFGSAITNITPLPIEEHHLQDIQIMFMGLIYNLH